VKTLLEKALIFCLDAFSKHAFHHFSGLHKKMRVSNVQMIDLNLQKFKIMFILNLSTTPFGGLHGR
jgi:hypothetical protein